MNMNEDQILRFINPATGDSFGQMPMNTAEDVVRAHAELREAFPVWSQKTVAERLRVLRKLQAVLIDSLDEITAVLNQDCGKSRQDAMIEVLVTVDVMDQYRKHAARWLQPRRVPRGLYLFKNTYIRHQPYGVVGVLAPWNYPLALSIPPVISALIAGNTVMLKPSEVTAATGLLMDRLFQRVPELRPFIRVIHGDGSVGAALVAAKPDYIFLTGSTPTGRKVLQSAAEHLIPVACELGGKDAMIVLEDADIDAAALWGVWGANFNSGQTCMSVERVYVVESVYEQFLHKAVEATKNIRVGYSEELDSPYYMGPVTDPRQVKTIRTQLEEALAKGARVLIGGKINKMFVEPTVMVNVDHSMLIMQEETFGPIMPVMRVRDEKEAIQLANDCSFGLGVSVWSRDLARAQRVASQVEASSVVINDTIAQFAVPMLPFGGIKNSGYGRIHGKEGLMQFTRPYAYAVGNAPYSWDVATILRRPGHYQAGAAIMRLAFGTSSRQRLEPVSKSLQVLERKVDRRKAALGIGLAGLLGAAAFSLVRLINKNH
jgi:acyl-CoA reductase-like NAD-dependent aldehyde dehydrogenase